jgi:pyrimidine-nucleoside phosphorylase
MYSLIKKKRDGMELSSKELRDLIGGFVSGEVTDYQMAAFLMAVYFRGMTARETADLTAAMVASGATIDLSALPGITVDKHSTGGVGDKTTLVLGPLLAAAGYTVAKMSGRGLGHTGGTLDKLESIPGFSTSLSTGDMTEQARRIGVAVVAQSANLVPADGLLYALRDVTATVDSMPLIASSIMSKKIAAGARAIVLDVKVGSGAFMQTPDQAFALAHALVDIGSAAGRSVEAIVTSMDQPLGFAVGNALEVREAVDTLQGRGPADLRELCLVLATRLGALAQDSMDTAALREPMERLLANGDALERFRAMVAAQGGDTRVVDDPESVLPRSAHSRDLLAASSGFVSGIDAMTVGEGARALGAGRLRKGDPIDHGAGIVLRAKVATWVDAGTAWATAYAADERRLDAGSRLLDAALSTSATKPSVVPLVHGVVDRSSREMRYF